MADVTPVGNPVKKMKLSPRPRDEIWIASATREELVERVLKQQTELDTLTLRRSGEPSVEELRETIDKLKAESTRVENMMLKRLATKERELHNMMTLNQEMKIARNPSLTQLQSMMLDPTVNLMFQHMKQEMDASKSKLEQAQSELAAWKFTPDSQAGKRLMAKCRMLLQENEDLGKAVSAGKIAKLEGDIALQKKLILEMKKSETDTEEFLGEMDEDMEQMQCTIYLLQQELKETKDKLAKYELPPSAAASAAQTTVVKPPAAALSSATLNGNLGALTLSSKDVVASSSVTKTDDLNRNGSTVCLKLIKTEILDDPIDDVGLHLEESHRRGGGISDSIISSSGGTHFNHLDETDVKPELAALIGGQTKDRTEDDLIGKIVAYRTSSPSLGIVNCASRTTAAAIKMQIDDDGGASEKNGSPDCGYGTADSPGQDRHRAAVGKLDAYRTS